MSFPKILTALAVAAGLAGNPVHAVEPLRIGLPTLEGGPGVEKALLARLKPVLEDAAKRSGRFDLPSPAGKKSARPAPVATHALEGHLTRSEDQFQLLLQLVKMETGVPSSPIRLTCPTPDQLPDLVWQGVWELCRKEVPWTGHVVSAGPPYLLDVGSQDGVQPGMRFTVKRASMMVIGDDGSPRFEKFLPVGLIEVEEVEARTSMAKPIDLRADQMVRQGDLFDLPLPERPPRVPPAKPRR